MVSIETLNVTTTTTTTYRMELNDQIKVEFEQTTGESWMPCRNTIVSIWIKIWGCPDYIDILPFRCELKDTRLDSSLFDLQDDIVKHVSSILADLLAPFLHLEDGIYEVKNDDDDDEEEGFKW